MVCAGLLVSVLLCLMEKGANKINRRNSTISSIIRFASE